MKKRMLVPLGIGLLLLVRPTVFAQPLPHGFSGIARAPDGIVTLSLTGSVSNLVPGLTGAISNQFRQMFDLYVVEASTNLMDWTPLAGLLRTNNDPNLLVFQDTNTAGLSQRYYRTFTNHLLTAFPKPSGPFAVGTVDRLMIDPARTNLYRYTPKTNAFMVTFWYPADAPGAGVLPAAMWDLGVASDTSMYAAYRSWGAYGADTQWAQISPKMVGHRFYGVPLAAGTSKYPVLLYSPGMAANRTTGSQNAEELASHGYVVVSIDHTDCWGTQFPDGRYLLGTGASSGGADVTDKAGRRKDMNFLVDELARLDSGDPLFVGRFDLERIGTFGISSGGIVIDTCRSNSLVKCAAIWDGDSFAQTAPGLQKPFLAALGQTNFSYALSQWLFNQATTNAVLLQIRGADHMTGADAAWSMEIPWGRGPALAFDACLVWFFDTYLKGESPPFPTNAEIINVRRK